MLKLRRGKLENLTKGALPIKTLPVPIGDHTEEEIQTQARMAHSMEITSMEELMIHQAIALGVPHGKISYRCRASTAICVCISRSLHSGPIHPKPRSRLSYTPELRLYLAVWPGNP